MSTCNDCYNQFMCMQHNKAKYKRHWDSDTICKDFEDDQLVDIEDEGE